MSTRSEILTRLEYAINDLEYVGKATLRQMRDTDAAKWMPYVFIDPSNEAVLASDEYGEKCKIDVTLVLKSNEDKLSLEKVIWNIKDLIKNLDLDTDLGSSVHVCNLIAVQETDVSDAEKTKYSSAIMVLEIIYTNTIGDSTYPSIESRTLTEPTGYAHYKLYKTLTSGSTDIQPLGTLVCDRHSPTGIFIPAGSGSISIDTINNEMDVEDDAIYGAEYIENHMISFNIRVHSAFLTEYSTIIPKPFIDRSIIDNITRLLWGSNADLGDYYRVHSIGPALYNQTFEVTAGASIDVVIEKVVEY